MSCRGVSHGHRLPLFIVNESVISAACGGGAARSAGRLVLSCLELTSTIEEGLDAHPPAARGASPARHRDARCARPARRAAREYRLYLTEAQRRRAGCSARRMQRELHHGLPGHRMILAMRLGMSTGPTAKRPCV